MKEKSEGSKPKDIKFALEDLWAQEEALEEKGMGEKNATVTEPQEKEQGKGDQVDHLPEDIQAVIAEAEEMRETAMRMKAEFDNFRKRTQQEKANWTYQALEPLLGDLLSVLDDFQRALDAVRSVKEAKAVVDGVQMISDRLFRVLVSHGLERIPCEGEVFDPEIHEGVMREFREGVEPGTILEELQPGYRFKEQILRHPKVKIAVAQEA